MHAALMSTMTSALPVIVAVSFAMPSRRDLKEKMIGRFASSVAWILVAAWMSAAPEKTIATDGGWHSAFAETLASQFASHFADAMQPPSSLPPSHLRGSKSASHLPSHFTVAV